MVHLIQVERSGKARDSQRVLLIDHASCMWIWEGRDSRQEAKKWARHRAERLCANVVAGRKRRLEIETEGRETEELVWMGLGVPEEEERERREKQREERNREGEDEREEVEPKLAEMKYEGGKMEVEQLHLFTQKSLQVCVWCVHARERKKEKRD